MEPVFFDPNPIFYFDITKVQRVSYLDYVCAYDEHVESMQPKRAKKRKYSMGDVTGVGVEMEDNDDFAPNFSFGETTSHVPMEMEEVLGPEVGEVEELKSEVEELSQDSDFSSMDDPEFIDDEILISEDSGESSEESDSDEEVLCIEPVGDLLEHKRILEQEKLQKIALQKSIEVEVSQKANEEIFEPVRASPPKPNLEKEPIKVREEEKIYDFSRFLFPDHVEKCFEKFQNVCKTELLLYGSTKAPKMAASLETNLIPFFIELSKADSELRKAIFARLQSLLKPMLKSSLETALNRATFRKVEPLVLGIFKEKQDHFIQSSAITVLDIFLQVPILRDFQLSASEQMLLEKVNACLTSFFFNDSMKELYFLNCCKFDVANKLRTIFGKKEEKSNLEDETIKFCKDMALRLSYMGNLLWKDFYSYSIDNLNDANVRTIAMKHALDNFLLAYTTSVGSIHGLQSFETTQNSKNTSFVLNVDLLAANAKSVYSTFGKDDFKTAYTKFLESIVEISPHSPKSVSMNTSSKNTELDEVRKSNENSGHSTVRNNRESFQATKDPEIAQVVDLTY